MNDEPVVWHYGLMADRWAEFLNDTPELDFLRQAIARYGEPVLDLACGAGRVLIPLLASGIDVDGCDISKDMLDRCAERAAHIGAKPKVYQHPMDAFDLPRRYRTIFICSSFGLAGSRDRDLETLRRCRAQLEEGGALIVNIDAEYTSAESWDAWLPEQRQALPEPWPTDGSRRIGSDGSEHVAFFRTTSMDPLEQSYSREVRLEKWQSGSMVAAEEYALRGNMYLKPEMCLMLRIAGFRDVSVTADWTLNPATADSEELVITAER